MPISSPSMRRHQLHSCCSNDHRPFCLPKKSTHTLPAACTLRLPRLLRTTPRQPSAMLRSSSPSSRPTASLGSLIHHPHSSSCAACLATTFRFAQVTRVHQDPIHAGSSSGLPTPYAAGDQYPGNYHLYIASGTGCIAGRL